MKILAIQNRMGIGDTVIYLPYIKAISEKFNTVEIKTTFQSRFGPQEWLQPYTDKTLESLPKEGKET